MKDQHETPYLKDENKEISQAEIQEQITESLPIINNDTPIVRETEEEKSEKIEAVRENFMSEKKSWSEAAFDQSNKPVEEFDSKVVHMPVPEKHKSRGVGFLGKLAFSLGLTGIATSGFAKNTNAEKDLSNTGTVKEAFTTDPSETHPKIEKITPLNVEGQKVAGLEMVSEILVPYSDTTKEVAILKFKNDKQNVSVATMIEAIQQKGYEVALPGMMEKMLAENPKLVSILDKNGQFLVSLIEKTKEADGTKPTEGYILDENNKVKELKPEIEAYKTYAPGLHRINKNDDPSTISETYAAVVYKKVPQKNTAVYTDGLTKK